METEMIMLIIMFSLNMIQNLLTNIFQLASIYIKILKKSSCCGGSSEFRTSESINKLEQVKMDKNTIN